MNSDNSASTEQVWRLLSDQLRSFLLRRVSDDQVADDLLQETFVRIHRTLHDQHEVERIPSWVFQIARNLVIDHYRSKSHSTTDLTDTRAVADEEQDNLNELVAGWLPQMIAQLPEKYREAVELYELKGVSQQGIASELGLSLSGAKSRVQRGREKLKSLLLDCCSFERDRRGNVIGYDRRGQDCAACDECES